MSLINGESTEVKSKLDTSLKSLHQALGGSYTRKVQHVGLMSASNSRKASDQNKDVIEARSITNS